MLQTNNVFILQVQYANNNNNNKNDKNLTFFQDYDAKIEKLNDKLVVFFYDKRIAESKTIFLLSKQTIN